MDVERRDLGERADIDAVTAIMPVDGLTLVDVGCGPGRLARELAKRGATVFAVEPDPIQAAKNRDAAPTPNLTFVEGRAEALPLDAAVADGVFLFRSLHHVPVDAMDAALTQAARVLKPASGFLCVAEPGMTGTQFRLTRHYNDETMVRTQAQAALSRAATRLFARVERFRFTQVMRVESFEALVARAVGQTFNDNKREQIDRPEVREAFEAGRTDAGDYIFHETMLVDVFREPVAGR